MQWQDLVLTAGSLFFIIGLFPSVLSKDKPALSTSLITGTVLLVFTIVYATLALWITTVLTFATCIIWYILAFQKVVMNRKQK